jgi:hypothetical protein
MADNKSIKEAIRDLVKTDDVLYSVLCKVKSVDTTNNICDCEPINGDADLLEVRLMAQNTNGFLIIPSVDSVVVVTMLNKYTGYVAMFSDVDEIQLNGDNYDGLVRIGELVDKLNNLENAFNQHITTYNTHTHAGVIVGPYTTAPPVVPDTQVLTPTQQLELENLTCLHGNGT